eukprot:6485357-Amphidinium_carterae.1
MAVWDGLQVTIWEGLPLIPKVLNDKPGWVATDPNNGLVWTKGFSLLQRGVGDGGSLFTSGPPKQHFSPFGRLASRCEGGLS